MHSYLVGRRQYIRYNGLTCSTTVVQFSIPLGSVLGPLFFILYTADVLHIAEQLGFFIHGYADDLQLYDHCLACDTAQLFVRLAHCIDVMGQWMSSNHLKLNATKTEFIWLSSTRRLARCTFDPIIINGIPIKPSTICDLCAYFDSGMSYTDHVTRLTRTCFFHIRQLRSVGRSLRILRTPWFEHWFWCHWITATDSSVGHQSVSSARCLASCALQLVWFCCFLTPAVLKTRFVPCCTGWLFLRG